MTTIRQLAQIAGVSHSTVSRALRGDRRISTATSRQIQELAQLYHYRPNRLAQSALSGKSTTIGCLLSDVSLPFESRLLRGMLDIAYLESYRVIPLESHGEPTYTRQAIATLLEQRVTGILIVSAHSRAVPQSVLLEMRSQGVPAIALDYATIAGEIDRVCTDERQLAETAIDFFYQLGHRTIAYIGPPVKDYRGARTRAVLDALRRRGLSGAYITDWDCGQYHDFDAPRVLQRLWSSSITPTAILCWEDRVAGRVIHALQRMGVQVPRHVSVMGCANLSVTEFIQPQLTSIEQHPEEMGRQACRRLLNYLEQAELPLPRGETIHIPVTLVKRDSCARAQRECR